MSAVLEAVWLQHSFRGEELYATPRIAIHVAPGFLDNWAIKWELYHATNGRSAYIACLGAGGQETVFKYCKERACIFEPFQQKPSLDKLRLVVKPDLLIALDKGAGVVSKYAREAGEVLDIPVILRQAFNPAE